MNDYQALPANIREQICDFAKADARGGWTEAADTNCWCVYCRRDDFFKPDHQGAPIK